MLRSNRSNPLADASPKDCWARHGYALAPLTDESIALAASARELVQARQLWTEGGAAVEQSRIAGDVLQTSLAELEADLQRRFHALARKQMNEICPGQQADRATFACVKALVAMSGKGAQPIHWDSIRWAYSKEAPEASVVSVLLYCTPCNSTSVPRFPVSTFADKEPDADGRRLRAVYLAPGYFHSVPVQAGHMLFFRHSVPHAGVACEADAADKQRIVLFDMFSQRLNGLSAEDQYFEWSYLRDAFGDRSEEYKRSLLANLHHDPIGREPRAEERARLRAWLGLEAKPDEDA
jgi:hypothetical protein